MHALAESTVLALHEFADLGSDITSVGPPVARQQRALGNLIMILTSMGSSGRTKPMMAILLVTLAKYTTSSQHPQVATWFSEYFQTWGVSYEEMMSLQFRSSWFHGRSEPTAGGLFDDLSQQPLHTVAARGSSVSTQSLSASEQSSGPMISPVTFGDSAMGLTGMTPHGSLFNDGTTAFLFKQLTDGSARGADHSAHVTEDPSASSMSIPRMEEDRAHSETYRGVALDSGEFFPNNTPQPHPASVDEWAWGPGEIIFHQ
ncbi:hypothetical protein FRC17_011089 [Serendipita sp. 399]|nr:hypothetical protein FRC17_011089 [Serendipita sp. 399]